LVQGGERVTRVGLARIGPMGPIGLVGEWEQTASA
jgi:hypothetical protein